MGIGRLLRGEIMRIHLVREAVAGDWILDDLSGRDVDRRGPRLLFRLRLRPSRRYSLSTILASTESRPPLTHDANEIGPSLSFAHRLSGLVRRSSGLRTEIADGSIERREESRRRKSRSFPEDRSFLLRGFRRDFRRRRRDDHRGQGEGDERSSGGLEVPVGLRSFVRRGELFRWFFDDDDGGGEEGRRVVDGVFGFTSFSWHVAIIWTDDEVSSLESTKKCKRKNFHSSPERSTRLRDRRKDNEGRTNRDTTSHARFFSIPPDS